MKKIENKLTGVPATMLIAIRARYRETQLKGGIIYDPKSVEIMDQIAHDFGDKHEVSLISQKGVAVRTEIIDELTLDFIARHPDGIVVNLGCGLDTRYYRLGGEKLLWYDLDMPEAIELRRHFFAEGEYYHFIARSVLDFSWMNEVDSARPTLFIAEGLLMYLDELEIKGLFRAIKGHFPSAEIVFEAISPMMVRHSAKHMDVNRHDVRFKWGIRSGREVERWGIGIRFLSEYFYDRHLDKMPWWVALLYRFPFRRMMKIIHLRF